MTTYPVGLVGTDAAGFYVVAESAEAAVKQMQQAYPGYEFEIVSPAAEDAFTDEPDPNYTVLPKEMLMWSGHDMDRMGGTPYCHSGL